MGFKLFCVICFWCACVLPFMWGHKLKNDLARYLHVGASMRHQRSSHGVMTHKMPLFLLAVWMSAQGRLVKRKVWWRTRCLHGGKWALSKKKSITVWLQKFRHPCLPHGVCFETSLAYFFLQETRLKETAFHSCVHPKKSLSCPWPLHWNQWIYYHSIQWLCTFCWVMSRKYTWKDDKKVSVPIEDAQCTSVCRFSFSSFE